MTSVNSSPKKRFCLVTPSYQQGQFLRVCLESVLSQQRVAVDYFVSDGGSQDESVDILRSYGDRLAWQTGPDGGQVRAINRGLRRGQGEYCGFLNSDDLLLPDALSAVEDAFVRHPNVDVVYGRAWYINEAGQRTREYPSSAFSREVLVEHCFLAQPATFWRRSLHDKFGWFDPAYDNTFDYEFWLRLAVNGVSFFHLPQFLAASREHSGTKTRRQRGRIFAEIRRMQLYHLGYCGRNWWEQQLRYWRDERGGLGTWLPGKREQRMYRLAWWPYIFWRTRLGGPPFYQVGHWRA